ncbi:OB-fold nucleic acid binding domain-containing protein [Streptomyces anulatus]
MAADGLSRERHPRGIGAATYPGSTRFAALICPVDQDGSTSEHPTVTLGEARVPVVLLAGPQAPARDAPGQRVLVADVRASTQPPPIASGRRIIFVTLEDGSGLVDLAFFEDSHERCAHTVFHHGLLLVRGTVEARGPRRTVVGEMAWDLDELATARATHDPQAVLDLLGQAPAPTPAQPGLARTIPDGTPGATSSPPGPGRPTSPASGTRAKGAPDEREPRLPATDPRDPGRRSSLIWRETPGRWRTLVHSPRDWAGCPWDCTWQAHILRRHEGA